MQEKTQIIVATYNILFGLNTEEIIENIYHMAQDGVNIFCLQEIINTPNEEFIIDKMLKRLGSHWKGAYHVGKEISKLSIGTAILWDTRILKYSHEEKILLPKIESFNVQEQLFYYVIGVPGIPLQRKAITCYFSFGQTELRVTCVHVDNVGGPTHRMKQVSYLMSQLQSLKTPKHEIICGDFNTFDLLKNGYERKVLQEEIGEDFVDATHAINWTADIHNSNFKGSIDAFPWFVKTFNVHIRRRLDYIWVKNFVVEECNKLEVSGSDHYPVIAKLTIKAPEK